MQHHEMRRKERLVTDRRWMEEILKRGEVLHLGLADAEGWPYVVPLGYGYESGVLYLHGAPEGKKNDILTTNPKACFQVTLDVELIRGDTGSNFSMKYRSVTGFGRVASLTNLEEKNHALKVLMDHYDGPHVELTNNDAKIWVAKLEIESMTGKNNAHPL